MRLAWVLFMDDRIIRINEEKYVVQPIEVKRREVSDIDRKVVERFKNFFKRQGLWGREEEAFQDTDADQILSESEEYAEESEGIVMKDTGEYFSTDFNDDEEDELDKPLAN